MTSEHFADGSMAKEYVEQDEYTRSMALLAVDNVRMKADIIQLRDEIKRQKESWASLCAMNVRIERQRATIEEFKKKLLTTQVVLAIVALSAAIAAFI